MSQNPMNRRPGAPSGRPIPGGRPAPGARQVPEMPGGGPASASVSRVDWGQQEMTQGLINRGEQSYRVREGDSYKGVLDQAKTRNFRVAKATNGDKYWSVIPYLAGPNDPEVVAGRMNEGDPTYTCGVYAHKNIGPNRIRVICPARTYGKPCPICEYRDELNRIPPSQDEAENKMRENEIRSLLTGKYMVYVYYIWDRDNEQKGLQIYEISGFFFERHIQGQAKDSRTGGYIPFASPLAGEHGGRDITFKIGGTADKQDWSEHKLNLRNTPIPAHILDQASVPLDSMLNIMSYPEIYDLFHSSGGGEEEETEGQETAGNPPECFQTGYCNEYEDCIQCVFHEDCLPFNNQAYDQGQQEYEAPPGPEPPQAQVASPTIPGQRTTGPAGPPPRRPTPRR